MIKNKILISKRKKNILKDNFFKSTVCLNLFNYFNYYNYFSKTTDPFFPLHPNVGFQRNEIIH